MHVRLQLIITYIVTGGVIIPQKGMLSHADHIIPSLKNLTLRIANICASGVEAYLSWSPPSDNHHHSKQLLYCAE